MKCRICDSTTQLLEEVTECIDGHASLQNRPYQINRTNMEVYKCDSCLHMQSHYELPKSYYDGYDLYSESEQTYYGLNEKKIEERIVKLRGLAEYTRGQFVDVGCGRGDTLDIAMHYFDKCIGIEPSEKECQKAILKGHKVMKGYLDADTTFSDEIGAFYSSMVFEHLEAPLDALKQLSFSMTEEGVGLINVPHGERIYRKGLFHQFISEHINYYTPFSLVQLVYLAGLEVIEMVEHKDLIELDVYVRKPIKSMGVNATKQYLKDRVQDLLRGCQRVAVWGAGNKSHFYSPLIEGIRITSLLDSNAGKAGKYISGLDIPTEKATDSLVKNSDAIIIFASTYNKEIIHTLRNSWMYSGKIVFFEDNEVMVDDLE